MKKKATKLKVTEPSPRRSVKRPILPVPIERDSPTEFAQSVIAEARVTRGSDEEVLSSLISSITEKLGGQGIEKSQMDEFLSLILDTDPTLKEEILQGLTTRK